MQRVSLRECFLHLFSFPKEHQDFNQVYFSSQHEPRISDYALLEVFDLRLRKFMRQSKIDKQFSGIRILPNIFLSGLTAFIQKWLAGDCRELEDELLLPTPYSFLSASKSSHFFYETLCRLS